ncbi:MAG: hypothetical protein EBT79_09105 [Actinobacteria bacterium]|jgi:hypothetical protein|nr:hypothetical protein [Actinomycetota bacterium]
MKASKPSADISTSKPSVARGDAAPSKHDTLKPVQPVASRGQRGSNQSSYGMAAGKLVSAKDKCHGIEQS